MQTKSFNIQDIKSLEDLNKVDVSQLIGADPSKIKLGTDLHDASIIAQAYERGAHYTPKEVAVFATLNRQLDNYRGITKNVSAMLKTYLMVPEESMSKTLQQQAALAKKAKIEIPGGAAGGAGANTGATVGGQEFAQAFKIGKDKEVLASGQPHGIKGASLGEWAKDCIPCGLRIQSWLELHPNIDLANILKAALNGILGFLNGIGDLLRNLDVFGDFCSLLDLFNFICIPDMQRILMLLSALLMLEIPSLDGLIGMVQCLIAPIFSGILSAIMGIFDQFILLVANPLQCIVDALNLQLSKLPKGKAESIKNTPKGQKPPPTIYDVTSNAARQVKASSSTQDTIKKKEEKVSAWVDKGNKAIKTGMEQANAVSQTVGEAVLILKNMIEGAIAKLKEMIRFYLGDFNALMGEMGSTDASYIGASLHKLQIVRLISFVTALITALASGNAAFCKNETMPEKHEINNFYNNYLSPNSPFTMTVDDEGQIHLGEKTDLPNPKNVFEFKGQPLVAQVAQNLLQPVRVIKPCRLEVTASEANTLNKYISELNSL